MQQVAPEPEPLYRIVEHLFYKPGWVFKVADTDRGQGSCGLTFEILITTVDSYHPERKRSVVHYMIVPAASYDERSWRRWVFEQILLVESHEACEFFRIGDERPYAPSHGPGNDPYMVREVGTDLDARTSFRGHVKAT